MNADLQHVDKVAVAELVDWDMKTTVLQTCGTDKAADGEWAMLAVCVSNHT